MMWPQMRRRFRFSLRTLMAAVLVFSIALSFVRWWTQPYALTGSYPNGIRAWEQWERRTLTAKIAHLKTVRFYRNGQKAYEYCNGQKKYWSPDGKSVTGEKESWTYFSDHAGTDQQDPDSKRPMESFLYWWNGW